MIYKIFEDGEVINTIVASEDFVKTYCEENGYTYELEERPEPEPEPAVEEPTAEEDLLAMAVDHEYRITLLELGLGGEF